MVSDLCSKHYPKEYQQQTSFDSNGYVQYRRQPNWFHVIKNNVKIDNRYVVPYNRELCLHYMAHINVEYYGWNMLIKYLFKYISKGVDRVHYTITNSNSATNKNNQRHLNEIQNFLDGRFICSHEAAWKIFNFVIHDRNPAVQVLAVHLENKQNISFRDNAQLQNIIQNTYNSRTTLTEWLYNNNNDSRGRDLTYVDYLTKYRWHAAKKMLDKMIIKENSCNRKAYIHISPFRRNLFSTYTLSSLKGLQIL
ncbi:uncharacterized protein LOC111903453 [Lactuca sativa]|uniref:uncharacterized protein LOC111903453 n=1 Tax=Lactuca sativa TaxID=4236 RepID=UPI000CD97E14|nr:uncharacterized protein LOC111903453 [Lactuca sativa]